MSYTAFNKHGIEISGDPILDEALKDATDEDEGWVEDADGNVVYESPARKAALKGE